VLSVSFNDIQPDRNPCLFDGINSCCAISCLDDIYSDTYQWLLTLTISTLPHHTAKDLTLSCDGCPSNLTYCLKDTAYVLDISQIGYLHGEATTILNLKVMRIALIPRLVACSGYHITIANGALVIQPVRVLDATRVADGSRVMIKMLAPSHRKQKDLEELDLLQHFSTSPFKDDSSNHVVPCLDSFPIPGVEGCFVVMPLLGQYKNPPFYNLAEVHDLLLQLFEVNTVAVHVRNHSLT
jgi:hypothetical protein